MDSEERLELELVGYDAHRSSGSNSEHRRGEALHENSLITTVHHLSLVNWLFCGDGHCNVFKGHERLNLSLFCQLSLDGRQCFV